MFPKLLRCALFFALVLTWGCNEPTTDSRINAAYFMGRLIAGEVCSLKVICRANTAGKSLTQLQADLSPLGGPSQQPLTFNPDGTWRAYVEVVPKKKGLKTILLTAVDNESIQTVHEETVRVHAPGKAIAIDGGDGHTLALKADGTVACWGFNLFGQCNVPAGLSDVVAVAAANLNSFALKSDGTVACWGDNGIYICSDMEELNDIVGITGVGIALKADGTVIDPDCGYYDDCDFVESLSNIRDLKTSFAHHLAIQSDGTVACWGAKSYGECDVPEGLTDVVAVAGGYLHSLALTADGRLVAWGNDIFQKLDNQVPPGLGKLTAIDTKGNESSIIYMGLRRDGTVELWSRLRVKRGPRNCIAIASGWRHYLALGQDGSVKAWGDNFYGQCTVPEELQ